MYAGRVACYPLVSHGEYTDGTDRQTDGRMPGRYITLSARWGQRNNVIERVRPFWTAALANPKFLYSASMACM